MTPAPLRQEPTEPGRWFLTDGSGRTWTYHRESLKWVARALPDTVPTFAEAAAGGELRAWDDLAAPVTGRRV